MSKVSNAGSDWIWGAFYGRMIHMDSRKYTLDENGQLRAHTGELRRSKLCPRCSSELEVFRSRRPRSFRVLGVLAFGWPLFFGYTWMVVVVPYLEPHIPEKILFALFLALWIIPPGLLGFYLKKQPRLIPMECYTCGWKAQVPIAESRAYEPAPDPDVPWDPLS